MTESVEMDTGRWLAVNTEIQNADIRGERALRVVKGESKLMRFDENTYARLRGEDFHDGVIELRMLSRLLPDAPYFARGFIGIAFRINDSDSEFEAFYLRPTNALAADPVRRSHGCQYFSYPGYTFSYFREYGIAGYEAPIACGLDEWITLKAVIRGDKAAFYVNGAETLAVDGLKHGARARGGIGLFVDIGTEGFFKDLRVTREA